MVRMTSAPFPTAISPARAPAAAPPVYVAAGQWRRAPDGVAWYVAAISPTARVVLLATDERDGRGEWVAAGGMNVPARTVAAWQTCEKEARTT